VIARAGRDIWIGLVTIALATGYLTQVGSIHVGTNDPAGVGARSYPTVLGWVLLATGAGLVVTSLAAARACSDAPPAEPSQAESAEPKGLGVQPHTLWGPPSTRGVQAAALVGLTVAYLMVLEALGFLLATAPYVACAMFIIDAREHYRGRRLVIPLAAGVVVSVALHLLFDAALGVPLPPGLLDPAWGM
jgi:hypothetical protein